MPHSDADVVRAVLDGDQDAYRVLVDRYSRILFRLAWRLTRSESDAEDVVQETLLRAYRHLGRYDPAMPFRGWLYRIATNCAMDVLRTRERRPEDKLDEVVAERDPRFQSSVPTPDRGAEGVEIRGVIRRTLETLSPTERVAFQLRHQEGMSIVEISQVIGQNENATKHNIFRAVQKMRAALSPLVGARP